MLLVRYLGVPLITIRLTASDCSFLLEKIMEHIDSWISRKNYFVGRLQLLTSIL